jgi:hypothetical protein
MEQESEALLGLISSEPNPLNRRIMPRGTTVPGSADYHASGQLTDEAERLWHGTTALRYRKPVRSH